MNAACHGLCQNLKFHIKKEEAKKYQRHRQLQTERFMLNYKHVVKVTKLIKKICIQWMSFGLSSRIQLELLHIFCMEFFYSETSSCADCYERSFNMYVNAIHLINEVRRMTYLLIKRAIYWVELWSGCAIKVIVDSEYKLFYEML